MTAAAIGASLMLAASTYTLFRYARQVARFLVAFAAAREAFRKNWRRPVSIRTDNRGPVSITLDPIQRETVSALVNFGQRKKKAEATVRAAGTAADVAALLRRCMERAA
jgi:hypothetical protein